MKTISTILVAITMLLCINTYAQIGANDPTFNSTDVGFGRGDAANANVRTSALQSDGKIIIGGDFTEYEGKESNHLARLNADGSLDASFNIGTGVNSSVYDAVYATAIQSDGKVIIGGNFTMYNGVTRNYLARLNADGSLDASFNIGTGANGFVYAIAIQSDGKIIIGGAFTLYNGVSRNGIVRLNSNGSLDVTFNVGTGVDYGREVYTLAIQSDGKIIIGGYFFTYNNVSKRYLARLNSDGSLDAAFDNGTDLGSISGIAIQSNGKIVIIGGYGVVRLNADGSLDATFNPGTGADDRISEIAIQSDGKIIIGGYFATFNGVSRNRIARLNADGSLDVTFNVGTGVANDVAWNGAYGDVETTLIQSDGKIIIGGHFSTYNGISRNNIVRLNIDGSLDVTFNVGTGVNGFIQTISKQSDGKMILGGHFTAYNNGMVTNNITRINKDGTRDATFNTELQTFNNAPIIYATAIQSDGKIIIGGDFDIQDTYYNIVKRIVRLNIDGSLDATFGVGSGADSTVLSVAIQSDGKIIISGNFTRYNGASTLHLARLNTNGSLDATFNGGTGTTSYDYEPVFATALQSDGKIIIGGRFTVCNGTPINHIARLNTNGSLDGTFNVGLGANDDIRTIGIQNDGKIIIGGNFTTYNGLARNRIARLNSNGSLDATFIVGTGANDAVLTNVIQGDNKIIIGGELISYNGTSRNGVARLNADGSLDATFDVGTGANNTVLASIIQNDGKVVIGGKFTSYHGTGRNRIARLMVVPCVNPTSPTTAASSVNNCGVKSTTLTITAGTLNDATDWKWYSGSCGGVSIGSGTSVTVSPTTTTTYYARSEGGCVVAGTCSPITITVNSLPDVTTKLNGAIITANQSGATYQWLDCNNSNALIQGEKNKTYAVTKNGNYAVTVTLNSCSRTSDCVDVIVTGIEKPLPSNNQFIVYPNPSNGTFTIQSTSEGFYSILNDMGQLIQTFELNDFNNRTMNLENLNPGIYFVTAFNKNKIANQKVVVMK